MNDEPRTLTAGQIAEKLGGRLVGVPSVGVCGINTLSDARSDEITFITDQSYARRWVDSQAAAAVVTDGLKVPGHNAASRALVFVPDAELATIELLRFWEPAPPLPEEGIHPTAWVHPEARLGEGVRIGPHVSVDHGSVVGDRTVLHAGVRIYAGVTLGEGCVIHANTVIRERCTLGRAVILHPNVSIGADGFGYRPAPDGSGLLKVPQIGTVQIHDLVEIGANTCVDRGKFGATVIGAGTKIDNLCQVAHNCRIGRACVIAGQCALAGSVVLGDGVVMAGQVGVADQLTIGSGATIAGGSGVTRNVPAGETWFGYPADRARDTLRRISAVHKLPDHIRRVSRLLQDGKR